MSCGSTEHGTAGWSGTEIGVMRRGGTYAELDRLQREIASRVREGGPGAILLSELAPVITLGKRALPEKELRLSPAALSHLGIGIYPTDRGGFATYHGPGQWVLFIVDSLERLTGDRRGVRRAVEGLLQVAHRAGSRLVPQLRIREGRETGVWSQRGKVASVGIHIERGVLLHGLSVNGFATPTSFVGLRPCGLDGVVPDYLIQSDTSSRLEDFERLGEWILEEARVAFTARST